MPNSINRRRVSGSSDSSSEVAELKKQLEDLRKLYVEDMQNVSNDMRILNDQLTQVAAPSDVTVVPSVDEITPPSNQVM